MKQLFCFGAAILSAALLTGCGEAREPGELVAQAGKQLSAGKYTQALRSADKAANAAPNRFDVLLVRAMVQERMGRTDLALAGALTAEKIAPTSFAVQYMLGRLYSAKPETRQEALIALSKALALKPGDRNTMILQANLYMGMRPMHAMRILHTLGRDTAMAASPGYRNELGVSQLLSGQTSQGGNNLSLAVTNAPRNPIFRLNYARYLDFYAQQPNTALTHYQTYLELARNQPGHDAYRKWAAARCAEIQRQRL